MSGDRHDQGNGRRAAVEEAVRTCYSTWGKTYFDDYYAEAAPYPPVHRDIVRDVVAGADARTLLDAGCGPASILRTFAGEGIDLYGFDLTPEMVDEAKRVMAESGVGDDHIWTGSVIDPAAYRAPSAGAPRQYDAAICVGVLPHIPAELDRVVMENMCRAVRPGGTVLIEARNAIFSMFTLNRFTWEFMADELIRFSELETRDDIDPVKLDEARDEIKARMRMDLPPVRPGKKGEPGYDEILSRLHNPFVVAEQMAATGFTDLRTLFYHYHRLPPMVEGAIGPAFRELSVEMEDATDWRGYFMASAFFVTGVRAE